VDGRYYHLSCSPDEGREEAASADKGVQDLRPAVYLAEEMGARLGTGALL